MSKKRIKIKEAKTMSGKKAQKAFADISRDMFKAQPEKKKDKEARKGLEDMSKKMFSKQPEKKMPPPLDLFAKKITKDEGFPVDEMGNRFVPEKANKQGEQDMKKLEPMNQEEILSFFNQLLNKAKNAYDIDYTYYLYTRAFDLLDEKNNREIPLRIRKAAHQKLSESKKITMNRIKSLVREELKKGK